MPKANAINPEDRFNLNRFLIAQEKVYDTALAELRSGEKRTHWMWFIFPQIEGLGYTPTSKYYAIKNLEEARQYLDHPVLGPRLLECSEAVLTVQGFTASDIFGYPDYLKLKSSMTLFSSVADQDSVFVRILDKYYDGERDTTTAELLQMQKTRELR